MSSLDSVFAAAGVSTKGVGESVKAANAPIKVANAPVVSAVDATLENLEEQLTTNAGPSGRKTGYSTTGSSRIPGRRNSRKKTYQPRPDIPTDSELLNYLVRNDYDVLMVGDKTVFDFLADENYPYNHADVGAVICALYRWSVIEAVWAENGYTNKSNLCEFFSRFKDMYEMFYNSTGSAGNFCSYSIGRFNINDTAKDDDFMLLDSKPLRLVKIVRLFMSYIMGRIPEMDYELDSNEIATIRSGGNQDKSVTDPFKALNPKARKRAIENAKSKKSIETISVHPGFYRFASNNRATGSRSEMSVKRQRIAVIELYDFIKKTVMLFTPFVKDLQEIIDEAEKNPRFRAKKYNKKYNKSGKSSKSKANRPQRRDE